MKKKVKKNPKDITNGWCDVIKKIGKESLEKQKAAKKAKTKAVNGKKDQPRKKLPVVPVGNVFLVPSAGYDGDVFDVMLQYDKDGAEYIGEFDDINYAEFFCKTYNKLQEEQRVLLEKFANVKGEFAVVVYDGFDGVWCRCTKNLSRIEAEKVWLGKTDNGTRATTFSHIDYYKVVSAQEAARLCGY